MSGSPASAAATAVESRLLRALAVLRAIVLLNTLVLAVLHTASFHRPGLAIAAFVVMTGWTAFVTWAYRAPPRRTAVLLGADLALTLVLLLLTPVVKGSDFSASLPGFWIVGALLACAIRYRTVGGSVAGLVLAAADVLQREHLSQSDYGDAFLLVISGATVGYLADSLQRMATERDAAEHRAAAAAERSRLARVVHDGVLQVLALTQRYGAEHAAQDPAAAVLGEQAARQERELRSLIRVADEGPAGPPGTVDVVALVSRLEQQHAVTVATPGFAVDLPSDAAGELVAAAQACLDNVRRHVGDDAPAFVLLQAFPDRVELAVRDDGPGIADGRLEEARSQGRLGVSESIRGRLAAVGGTATLTTESLGTEWELVLPIGVAHEAGG